MAKLYYKKIINGVINPDTGKAWAIDDVLPRWRKDVEEMLNKK